MNKLNELAIKYETDKKVPDGIMCRGNLPGHGYTTHYENILSGRKIKSMLEIGVCYGNSIRMWDEYFNYECHITGIDHSEKNANKKGLEKHNIRIFVGKQGDLNFLKTLCDREYDFIVDDGSHKTEDQMASFYGLFGSVSSGGLYCIEDLQVKIGEKTKEIFKSVINNTEMCRQYIPQNIFDTIQNVEFYQKDKLCVIYKK